MADAGRKDFSQQAKESLKPDSQKTYTEQAGEQLSSGVDRVQGAVLPNSEKSAHQSAFDSARGTKDDAKHGDGILDKAKDKLGLNNN
ncbi:hypothetical protein INT44_007396 [Umbelopsis vinacea]|uniref:Heat shock protein 9/12-domain-containing protein n=1 Tax=Umbelopsis vinacea TaxID=44442 RepID=A0A8H7PMG7_9FUNG|nr:hypothetical protein INT44_007396 [Umbelopsis vinacea]KAI9284533.1 putative chaperone/heat shock protein Hsp12 [Umbelopsis sp. AD052]